MIISTVNLTKHYDGKGGITNVSLSVKEGEVFGFLGKNGAGKSTFIRTLLGLLHPTSGTASVLGRPIGDIEARRKIGYLPELFQYHSWLSGCELLETHARLYGMKPPEIKRRIGEVLDIVGLAGHEKKRVSQYSKGMKQRIGLGCAVIADPELLFLDEPTSALDPIGRKHVRDIIHMLKGEGKTIFLNTHLLSEVELLSDRIGILDRGTIKTVGTLESLLNSPLVIRLDSCSEDIISALKAYDSKISASDGTITMNPTTDEAIPDIAGLIVSKGGRLYEIKRMENALERLFIKTVGEEDAR